MRTWLRDHGLLLVNLAIFIGTFCGMAAAGLAVYNDEQLAHGSGTVDLLTYLTTGEYIEAVFENWESEFLQMGMYVVLTVFLFHKGSSESKPIGTEAPQDQDPRTVRKTSSTPWPVRRGGLALVLYENSLAILFALLFIAAFALHAVGGAQAYTEEQAQHGQPGATPLEYIGTSQFWFESLQNWQSEFMVVALIIGASVFLRQRGSSQSKPVAAPHTETGD